MPDTDAVDAFDALLIEARACVHCADKLPHPPRPIVRASSTARLQIVGQAPGRRVHETGIPWNDASGDQLRRWLQLDRDAFYDAARIAIVPTGLCFPGTAKGSDLPPRPECAPLWQPRFRAAMPQVRLTLLIGRYAQAYFLGSRCGRTLTETVAAWADYAPEFFPLPHPSPRNQRWQKRNPWFDTTVVPALRRRLAELFSGEEKRA
jgi:uracil-DNA glycosylase